MIFGDTSDEYGDSSMGLTLEHSERAGSKEELFESQRRRRREKFVTKSKACDMGGSGATSGLASSVAFTPVQGIELINPELQETYSRSESYFGKDAAFVAKKRKIGDDGN